MTLDRWLRHRRRNEALAVLAIVTLVVLVNSTTRIMERIEDGEPAWVVEPWFYEITSALALLVLFPAVVAGHHWIVGRLPGLRARVAAHLAGALGFAVCHVALMVAFRELAAAAAGREYDFGPLAFNFLYELRKDLMSYGIVVAITAAYGFVLDRLRGEASFVGEEPAEVPEPYRRRFLVKMLQREFLVRVEDIDRIAAARNYVLLHCGSREYPMRMTMAALERVLDPTEFRRVHRSAIVQLSRVRAIHGAGEGEASAELLDGTRVPVSARHLPGLREALAQGPPSVA